MCKTGRISVVGQGQGWLGINCRVIQVSELKGELENKITKKENKIVIKCKALGQTNIAYKEELLHTRSRLGKSLFFESTLNLLERRRKTEPTYQASSRSRQF